MADRDPVTLTRVLHPSVLVRHASVQVLFDPCFGAFARRPLTSRVTGIRMPPPGILPEDLTQLAAIAITHDHEDHFDAAGLSRLPTRDVRVIVPAGRTARKAARLGFRSVEVLGLWETARGEGWSITAVPARAPNAFLEVSYVLTLGGSTLLHAGDTATHTRFEEIRERCAPAAACLPVSGVSLLGVRLTMSPEEAAAAAAVLKLKIAVPIHAEMGFNRLSGLIYRAAGSEAAFVEAARRLAPATRVLLARRGEPVSLSPIA